MYNTTNNNYDDDNHNNKIIMTIAGVIYSNVDKKIKIKLMDVKHIIGQLKQKQGQHQQHPLPPDKQQQQQRFVLFTRERYPSLDSNGLLPLLGALRRRKSKPQQKMVATPATARAAVTNSSNSSVPLSSLFSSPSPPPFVLSTSRSTYLKTISFRILCFHSAIRLRMSPAAEKEEAFQISVNKDEYIF